MKIYWPIKIFILVCLSVNIFIIYLIRQDYNERHGQVFCYDVEQFNGHDKWSPLYLWKYYKGRNHFWEEYTGLSFKDRQEGDDFLKKWKLKECDWENLEE